MKGFLQPVHLYLLVPYDQNILIYILFTLQVSDNYYRPDLTKPALARLSSVYRSLQVAKSGVKKKNRQPKH